jgi:hypothetical protein
MLTSLRICSDDSALPVAQAPVGKVNIEEANIVLC